MNRESNYLINGVRLEAVRNRQEQRVLDAMRKLLPETEDFCGCRICVEDVYAASLSKLPAQYVPKGSFVVRKDGPTDADVEQIVMGVIDQVRIHPNHEASAG